MRVRTIWVLLAAVGAAAACGVAGADSRGKPVPIFFDSDIGPDVDDAGAAAILHALADRGEAKILGMACCTSSPWGAPCLDAINTYYGRPDIPIGTFKGAGFLADSKYNRAVVERFPNDLRNGERAPDATEVYRRVLSRQKDRTAVICAVGPLNNLARLLESGPDRHSKLSGRDLVARKVRQLVIMGGRYPEGKEWNFEQDPKAAVKVAQEWPTPILASGFEIGAAVKTGGRLTAETPVENPVRLAYELYVGAGKDRESWDLTAVLAAVRGPEPLWSLPPAAQLVSVEPKDGANRARAATEGKFTYLVTRAPVPEVKRVIDDLLIRPPKRGR